MCSISENKPKKRKADHLEDNQTDASCTEQVTNKKQMTTVPTSDSLSNLLVQGLQSSDDKLINDVVNKKETVIESTINNLPNVYVEPLFNFLQKALYEQGENVNYVICLRKLFQCKISQILNIPNIRNNLKMLSDTLDLRCDLLNKCYKLKGRLDLMFLMLNKEDESIREENIVIYEESSSEDDIEEEDEDEDGENIIEMMNSDDENLNEDDEKIENDHLIENGLNEEEQNSDENSLDEDLMDD